MVEMKPALWGFRPLNLDKFIRIHQLLQQVRSHWFVGPAGKKSAEDSISSAHWNDFRVRRNYEDHQVFVKGTRKYDLDSLSLASPKEKSQISQDTSSTEEIIGLRSLRNKSQNYYYYLSDWFSTVTTGRSQLPRPKNSSFC